MQVEVDQSGKVENSRMATVLAFANGKRRAISIPATVKRKSIRELRQRGQKGSSFYYQIFATGLYLLLKDDITRINRLIVDVEYRRKDAIIREHLLNLFRRAGKKVDADQIQFARITKKSPAHRAAIQVLRGQKKPEHTVTIEELLKEFPKHEKRSGTPIFRRTT
jgi:uncharacterized membrane-anchored protein YjiN (DUF445 family)